MDDEGLCLNQTLFHINIFLILTTANFRYLLEHGASVSAVNNDGELAIDISESDEMEELLQKEIDAQVNIAAAEIYVKSSRN